ncbi:glycosyltransferase family 4 protein [Desulfurococcus mucosus]|uniref:glycosyltransferase family 4 protein n=1 Tax=Desulfurococcus mucosus TaxID=2275 RepID=UPI00069C6BD2|nr:glycosyltransferase family 4 protein [Desulfurococcus mucosus]
MRALLIADPALSLYGSITPVLLLGREFVKKGWEVVVVSPKVEDRVRERFKEYGIEMIDLGIPNTLFSEPSKAYVEYWAGEAILSLNSRRATKNLTEVADAGDIVINFSNTVVVRSDAWYAQGPVYKALDSAVEQFSTTYKLLYTVSRHVVKYLDQRLISRLAKVSRIVVSNSRYQKRIYEELGISVDEVIYEPLDTSFFQPTTRSPRGDYVVVYFGKETDYMAVKRVADAGVRIRAFGSKASTLVPKSLLKHPNIEALGYVSDKELVDLYSNALFTLFPFTEEPFGYVPVESMACGTPVLTYNRQGPSETVIHGVTGWLANSDEELVELAVRIWKEGYPSWMRARSRERALEFDVKVIAGKWLEVIKRLD